MGLGWEGRAGLGRCREIPGWAGASCAEWFPGLLSGGPGVPGLLPHPLLHIPPRDCLCSFDRRASCCSVHPHRWGPPLIFQPCSAAGQEPGQPAPSTPACLSPLPVDREGLLIIPHPHSQPLKSTRIQGLNHMQGPGVEGRGDKAQEARGVPTWPRGRRRWQREVAVCLT